MTSVDSLDLKVREGIIQRDYPGGIRCSASGGIVGVMVAIQGEGREYQVKGEVADFPRLIIAQRK
jgi:hypothetical protein